MSLLGAGDFSAFFEAVHGYAPFPWQERLAHQLVENGRWPSLLDLPTASGKTATIDAAVFHLACESGQAAARKAPMRILFVIDRRIVVDEAFRRARKIADLLSQATTGILLTVRERLAALSGDPSRPLEVVRLRGGVPQERDWARSPAQPLVAVSTVDQVGSRLLFRGYGVSDRMSPVHAGLVGSDALWLLDEVHLSRPLSETLEALATAHYPGRGVLADAPRLAPFRVVHLSATPGQAGEDALRLTEQDWAHPTLGPRLTASKIATLVPPTDELTDGFVEHAVHLAGLADTPASDRRRRGKKKEEDTTFAVESFPPVQRVAVVVNRVDLARQVFERLQRTLAQRHPGGGEVILLTGRVRPLDRDRLLERLAPLFAAPGRPAPERPIILVATQTIEAGADIDVDALVTEIAPIDSLRQRFGRLDRLGLRVRSPAVIVAPAKASQWKDPQWQTVERIYGDRARATAEALSEIGDAIDFGIQAFGEHAEVLSADLIAPPRRAPVLLAPYVDLWAATSPPPAATPEPSLFLHGPEVSADVQVIWRADLDPGSAERAARWLDVCPPSSLEAMPVPIWAVRRWLRKAREGAAALADVPEKGPAQDDDGAGRAVLRRQGDEWVTARAADLRPGDTLVVPCSYGGCDEYGWNPDRLDEPADLGAVAHYRQRLRGALRLTEATLANSAADREGPPTREVWRAIVRAIPDEEDPDAEALVADIAAVEGLPLSWALLLKGMAGRRPRFEFLDTAVPSAGILVWAERRLPEGLLGPTGEDDEARGEEAVTAYSDSSAIGVEVDLISHLDSVGARARDFAERAGLPPDLVKLVALAGRLHDLGKADPRFQADLRGESALARRYPELAALLADAEAGLLAKSGRRRGLTLAGAAPPGFRHEALSVALAQSHPEIQSLTDDERDLVLWLVGTHHGQGRPFFPAPADDAPDTEATVTLDGVELTAPSGDAPLRLDQGWFELSDRVRRRHGPWELARLEAIVRLADHAVSAEEQAEVRP